MPSKYTTHKSGKLIPLIALDNLKAGETKGIEIELVDDDNDIKDSGKETTRLDLIIWHQGDAIRVFKNACPHIGLPLETFPDRFLTADKKHLICSAHAATFNLNGMCIAGPCPGKILTEFKTMRLDGWLMLG
ncbi:MAG: Rieske (2Fe-2S) protein [Pseudomonadota bacterium]|nr:Rieske (2Fe-2S) protein [Pseudomonadota bacterium]